MKTMMTLLVLGMSLLPAYAKVGVSCETTAVLKYTEDGPSKVNFAIEGKNGTKKRTLLTYIQNGKKHKLTLQLKVRGGKAEMIFDDGEYKDSPDFRPHEVYGFEGKFSEGKKLFKKGVDLESSPELEGYQIECSTY